MFGNNQLHFFFSDEKYASIFFLILNATFSSWICLYKLISLLTICHSCKYKTMVKYPNNMGQNRYFQQINKNQTKISAALQLHLLTIPVFSIQDLDISISWLFHLHQMTHFYTPFFPWKCDHLEHLCIKFDCIYNMYIKKNPISISVTEKYLAAQSTRTYMLSLQLMTSSWNGKKGSFFFPPSNEG